MSHANPVNLTTGQSHRQRVSLPDLPREIIRYICQQIYDPLELTQQDRLTWGIFSTVDMHEERQDDLYSLIAFGSTCRKVRREARVVLFRCIRTPSVQHVEEVVARGEDWGRFVRSLIVDLTMFENDDLQSPTIRDRSSSTTSPIATTAMTTGPGPISTSITSPAIDPTPRPRSCWSESARLASLLQSLPSLQHLSFFADASDDSTLALLFASLITHPSLHLTPPPTVPPSPSTSRSNSPAPPAVISGGTLVSPPFVRRADVVREAHTTDDGVSLPATTREGTSLYTSPNHSQTQSSRNPQPLTHSKHALHAPLPSPSPSLSPSPTPTPPPLPLAARIQSFGWRQRAPPPPGFKQYSQSSTFVSILHLLRHAYRLSFLVLDADMDEMESTDVIVAMRELAQRTAPVGEIPARVSLMLCGPIKGWGRGFLEDLVAAAGFGQGQEKGKGKGQGAMGIGVKGERGEGGLKELFVDRPLKKSNQAHEITEEDFGMGEWTVHIISFTCTSESLRLLQVGSYSIPTSQQTTIVLRLAQAHTAMLVVGLMGEEGETNWWGIWRRASSRAACPRASDGEVDVSMDMGMDKGRESGREGSRGGGGVQWAWEREWGGGYGSGSGAATSAGVGVDAVGGNGGSTSSTSGNMWSDTSAYAHGGDTEYRTRRASYTRFGLDSVHALAQLRSSATSVVGGGGAGGYDHSFTHSGFSSGARRFSASTSPINSGLPQSQSQPHAHAHATPTVPAVLWDKESDIVIAPLQDGHMGVLEAELGGGGGEGRIRGASTSAMYGARAGGGAGGVGGIGGVRAGVKEKSDQDGRVGRGGRDGRDGFGVSGDGNANVGGGAGAGAGAGERERGNDAEEERGARDVEGDGGGRDGRKRARVEVR